MPLSEIFPFFFMSWGRLPSSVCLILPNPTSDWSEIVTVIFACSDKLEIRQSLFGILMKVYNKGKKVNNFRYFFYTFVTPCKEDNLHHETVI